MTEEFKKAVDAHNLISVRLSLSNELLLNPQSDEFGKMLEYAQNKLPDLYEEDSPCEIDMDRDHTTWDKDFLLEVKDALDLNFSEQKLALFMIVIKEVELDKANPDAYSDTRQTKGDSVKGGVEYTDENDTSHRRKHPVVKPIPASTVAIGAATSVAGICLKHLLLTAVGGAILIGGALLILKDNLEES